MNGPGTRAPFKPPRPYSASSSSASLILVRNKGPNRSLISRTPSHLVDHNEEQDQTQTKKQKIESVTRYIAQWRKKTNKKNKTWDGDGIIEFDGSLVVLKIEKPDGKYTVVARALRKDIDGVISVGKYEAEVDEVVNHDKVVVKSASLNPQIQKSSSPPIQPANMPFIPLKPSSKKSLVTSKTYDETSKDTSGISDTPEVSLFVNESELEPLPTEVFQLKSDLFPVVVDPILVDVLRPHQKDGVKFLYESVMGYKSQPNSLNKTYGALLADEMGLGKTLMTITTIFTLLKQNPISKDVPTCKKVLIACPVTLIANWRREFKKWLGEKVSVLTLNNKQTSVKDKQDLRNFGKNKVYQVVILNYEKIMTSYEELSGIDIDLLVCDEGHRLKNVSSKVVKVLSDLNIKRRILLTGTPIQNDLSEYYNIINFINPGVLGTQAEFQKNFLKPISRAREVNCMDEEVIRIGEQKSLDLVDLTKYFTLRRTSDILKNYLTPKTDVILFCPPTDQQQRLFDFIASTNKFANLSDNLNDSLAMILLFKKVCNSPLLLAEDKIFQSLQYNGPPLEKNSSKINVLIPLLIEIRSLKEKTVIISNYTQVLDLLQDVLRKLNIVFLRLDGQTPKKDRDRLVSQFNTTPSTENSVFLLSAKSGGVGLNLIGASRLILFDNDWNPSVDLQAMARIHRDGQKKPVFVYRLFTTGCIDEKIFQRQLMKTSLSDKFIDNKIDSTNDIFEVEDLKDLFTVVKDTKSNTHDLLDCQCLGKGERVEEPEDDSSLNDDSQDDKDSQPSKGWMTALDYQHLSQTQTKKAATFRYALLEYGHFIPRQISKENMNDKILVKIFQNSPDCVSYLFSKTSEGLN